MKINKRLSVFFWFAGASLLLYVLYITHLEQIIEYIFIAIVIIFILMLA